MSETALFEFARAYIGYTSIACIVLYYFVAFHFSSKKINFCEQVEYVKLSKKVSYHFAKFAIHELLIIEDRRISACGRIRQPQPDAHLPARCSHHAVARAASPLQTTMMRSAARRVRVWLGPSYSAACANTAIFYN